MLLFVFFLNLVSSELNLEYTSLLQISSSSYDQFTGTMSANNDNYEVTCDCTDAGMVEIEEVTCQPSKIKLSEEQSGLGSSYQDVSKKLGNYENYTYASVTRSSFRCLDGRIAEGILGTPGGDAGEFVLGLLVYQDLSHMDLNQTAVDQYFEAYLRCMEMPLFYMCTDQASLDHLKKELAITDLDIFSPDKSIQDDLLEALIEPQNVGDSHLKMMLEYPELYSIEKDVVEYYITSFYTML